MSLKIWASVAVILSTPSFAKACSSGDCQQGVIAGPYTAAQVAEFTSISTSVFPVCLSCTGGSWTGDQIEGIDAQQNIGNQYQFYNQAYDIDANIAVGPTVSGQNAQVLEWVNGQFVQAFDKVTGQPIFTFKGGTTAVPHNVAGLWSSSTQAECQNSTGNVQIIFDRLDNEFVISRRVVYMAAGIHQSAWCIAASSGSDLSSPNTQWYAYEYKMASVIPCVPSSNNCTKGPYYYYFPDWPRIGTWSNGFYITFDLQDPTANYTEAGFEACQLDRADITQGKASNPMTCYTYTVPSTQRPSLIHSVDVADIDSATGPIRGEPEYFLSIVNPSNAQQGWKGRNWCTSQTTPCTSNQLALFTWGTKGFTGPTFLAVNPYTPGCYNTSKAGQEGNTFCVPEPSTNTNDIGGYGLADLWRLPYALRGFAGGSDGEPADLQPPVFVGRAQRRILDCFPCGDGKREQSAHRHPLLHSDGVERDGIGAGQQWWGFGATGPARSQWGVVLLHAQRGAGSEREPGHCLYHIGPLLLPVPEPEPANDQF